MGQHNKEDTEFFEELVVNAKRNIEEHDDIDGFFVLDFGESKGIFPMMPPIGFREAAEKKGIKNIDEKKVITFFLKQVVTEMGCNKYWQVTTGWMTTFKDRKEVKFKPSQDPNRIETLNVSKYTKEGTWTEIIPFTRDGKKITYGQPYMTREHFESGENRFNVWNPTQIVIHEEKVDKEADRINLN